MNPMHLPNNNSAPAEHTFHSGASTSPAAMQQQMHDPNLLQQLGLQIEFYFSETNLVKDHYLRQFLEQNNGVVPIDMIANFPKMRKINATFYWGPNLSCPVEALPSVHPTAIVQSVMMYTSNVYLLQGQWLVHPFFHQNQQQQRRGRRTGTIHQRHRTTPNENPNPHSKSHLQDEKTGQVEEIERTFKAASHSVHDECKFSQAYTIKHLDSVGASHGGEDDTTTSPTVTPTSFASNENIQGTTAFSAHQDIDPSSSSKSGPVVQIENMPTEMVQGQVFKWLARSPSKHSWYKHAYIKPVTVEQCKNNPAVWWLTFDSIEKAKEALRRLDKKRFLNGSQPLCKFCGEEVLDDALDDANKKKKSSEGVADKVTTKPADNKQKAMNTPLKAQTTPLVQAHDGSSFMGAAMPVTPEENNCPAVSSGGKLAHIASQGNERSHSTHHHGMATAQTLPAYSAPWYVSSTAANYPNETSHHQTGFHTLPIGYPVMSYEEQQQRVYYGHPPAQGQIFPREGQMRRHSAPPSSPPRNLHHTRDPAPIVYESVPTTNGGYAEFFPIQPFAVHHTEESWHGSNQPHNVALVHPQPIRSPRRENQKWQHAQWYQQEHGHREYEANTAMPNYVAPFYFREYEANTAMPDMASLHIVPPAQQRTAPRPSQQQGATDDNRKIKKTSKPKNKNQKEKGRFFGGSDNNTPPQSGNGGKRSHKKSPQYASNSEFPPLASTQNTVNNNTSKKPDMPTDSTGYAKALANSANEEEDNGSM